MQRYLFWIIILSLMILPLFSLKVVDAATPVDSLIKGSFSTVYYYAADGYRYVFPNNRTFGSWFIDYSEIITVTDEELAQMPLKGNVTYRPGVRMVKIQTNPKVYVIAKGGILKWVKTEALAEQLYGKDWNKKIDDIPDVFFVNYEEGDPVEEVDEYNASSTLSQVETINKNRGIKESRAALRAKTVVGGSTIPATPAQPSPGTGTPATPATPAIPADPHATSTPATPAIPATPATPGSPGSPAIPAIPATPATPPTPEPDPDTTAPVISNIQAVNVTEDSATITWTTDELSNSKISYAVSSPIIATTTIDIIDSSYATSHSISLSNLINDIVYYYLVVSSDNSGNTATSSEQSFTILAPPAPPPPISYWSNNSLNVSGEYQSITWDSNGYGAVYGWNGKLYFIKLDSSGNKLSEAILATAPNYVFWTNIVWDGSKYGVVWPEANPHNLRFATIDIDGNVLSNIPLTAGTDNASTERPAILWTGSEYVLVWSGGWPDNFNNPYLPTKIIYFTKIASDGQTLVINKKKSITSGDARAANGPIVHMTWNGANFGVAWQDIRDSNDSNKPAIYFSTLDSSGNKLINDVKISGEGRVVGSPHIFSDGTGYNILWRESTAEDVNANSIYITKVDSLGNKLTANKNLNTKGDNEVRFSVARSNNGYGIMWTSYPENQIYFKMVDLDGNIVLSDELVSVVGGNNSRANITWNDSGYASVWYNVQNNQSKLYFAYRYISSSFTPNVADILATTQFNPYAITKPEQNTVDIYFECPVTANVSAGIIYGEKDETTTNEQGYLEGIMGVQTAGNCTDTDGTKMHRMNWFTPSVEYNYQIVFFTPETSYWPPLSADHFPEINYTARKVYTEEDMVNEIYRVVPHQSFVAE